MSLLVSAGKGALTRSGLLCPVPTVTVLAETKRYASRKRAKARKARKTTGMQRDTSGNIIYERKEKTPPLFTSLSVAQLTAPVFETDKRPNVEFPSFSTEAITRQSIGQAMEFTGSKEAMAQFGLPKKVWKDFKLLNKPCSVIRGTTIDIIDTLSKASKSPSRDSRLALSGTSGCGKSHILFQAVDWAVANGWLVLYLPRAVNFVNSTTPYTYDPRTQTFLQPDAAWQILHRTREANKKILGNLKANSTFTVDGVKSIPTGTSLYDSMNVTREEVAAAPVILDWIMSELDAQTTYPVLLAIDDFQALFNRTSYRDPHFKPIASYHLSTPRLLLSYASGRRSFAKGAIVGSLTSSDPQFPITPELESSLELASHGESDMTKLTMPWPYVKHSRFLSEYAGGLVNIRVPRQLGVDEAGAVYEIWMKHQIVGSKVHDELFMAKYVESAGNARDFVWKGLLGTLQT